MRSVVLAALFGLISVQSQSLFDEKFLGEIEDDLTFLSDVDEVEAEIARDENAEKQFKNLQNLLKKSADDMENNVKFAR